MRIMEGSIRKNRKRIINFDDLSKTIIKFETRKVNRSFFSLLQQLCLLIL